MIEEEKFKFKEIWRYIARYWGDWFPNLPSYQAFNARLNRLAGAFPYLLAQIISHIPYSDTLRKGISLIERIFEATT